MYLLAFKKVPFQFYDIEGFDNVTFWVKWLFPELKAYFIELRVTRAMTWWLSHETEMHS